MQLTFQDFSHTHQIKRRVLGHLVINLCKKLSIEYLMMVNKAKKFLDRNDITQRRYGNDNSLLKVNLVEILVMADIKNQERPKFNLI